MDYDLEIARIVAEIGKLKKKKPTILLQFPEGLKNRATKIVDEIESKVNCNCIIWMGSCYGSCDTPNLPEKLKIDLLVSFGHSAWKS